MSCKRIVEISAVVLEETTPAPPASIIYYTYEWEWRVQASIPPPMKTFGSNNGAWAGAKSMYVSSTNYASVDVSSTIRQMKARDTVRIENKTDSTIWASFVLAVPPIEYTNSFTMPTSLGDGMGAPANNAVYRVILSTGATQTTKGAVAFCLLEDGSIGRYNDVTGAWTYPTMPFDLSKGYARVISTTLLPDGLELIHNVYTQLWSWRKTGSQVVPPPAIEGEVGNVFNTDQEAINDARQRFVIKSIGL